MTKYSLKKQVFPSSFHKTGSLRVGHTEVEEQWFTNILSRANHVGCEMHFVSKEEASVINPMMDFTNCQKHFIHAQMMVMLTQQQLLLN